jgi:hypothetical protein
MGMDVWGRNPSSPAGKLATIIELGATARRLAPLFAHRKGGHRNMTYAFALEGLFQKRRVGRGC